MARFRYQYANQRIDVLELRRWWIAEQLGVSQRTLRRWLSGATSRVDDDKLTLLAALLDVAPEALVAPEGAVHATTADQIAAAKAMLASNLLKDSMPSHQWCLYERLAKGLVVEGLPKLELGQLYMGIALAVFRQGKLDETWQFAQLVVDIAHECGDRELALRANMLLSYRQFLAGYPDVAVQMDEANLAEARALDLPLQIAANLSNLADQYLHLGRIDDSIRLQSDAIERYTTLDQLPALTFCHLGMVAAMIEHDDIASAKRHLATARDCSTRGQFLRGDADCDLYDALICSWERQHPAARTLVQRALARYQALDISEARTYLYAAKIYRTAGDLQQAQVNLEAARERARLNQCRVYEAEIEREASLLSACVRH